MMMKIWKRPTSSLLLMSVLPRRQQCRSYASLLMKNNNNKYCYYKRNNNYYHVNSLVQNVYNNYSNNNNNNHRRRRVVVVETTDRDDGTNSRNEWNTNDDDDFNDNRNFGPQIPGVVYTFMLINGVTYLYIRSHAHLIPDWGASYANYEAGRYVTLFTSSMLHGGFFHLLMNTMGLYVLSPALSILPNGGVLLFILGASTFSSLFAIGFSKLTQHDRVTIGASGICTAMFIWFSSLWPYAALNVMFVPMYARTAVIGLIGIDLAGTSSELFGLSASSPFAHAGHLGGSLFGALSFFLVFRRLPLKK